MFSWEGFEYHVIIVVNSNSFFFFVKHKRDSLNKSHLTEFIFFQQPESRLAMSAVVYGRKKEWILALDT